MATPLVHRDEVVGFLATASSIENAYGPEHVESAERIGAQISGAIANSRLHAGMSRIAHIREVLVQIGRDASGARDIQGLYASVFTNLQDVFPIDRGVIALANAGGKSLLIDHVYGVDIKGLRQGDTLDLDQFAADVLAEPRLVSTDDTDEQSPPDKAASKLITAGLPSNIRVPPRARDSVIGFIAVCSTDDRAYDANNLALLGRISDQISPVIESLNLLDQVQSLAATVETTLDLVAISDLEGTTSYINPAGLKMLGVPADSSNAGISLTEFVPAEVVEVIQQTGLKQADLTGGWQAEISVLPRNAENSIPAEIQLVPVRNRDDEMTAVNVFMRDFREREAGQIARREFVSTVSHELRTPLTSMKMYTGMLGEGDDGELNDQQQRLVNNMKSTVDRLSRMVDDLNVVSLLEAGRFSLQIESFDMEELVLSAIEISEPNFLDRNMTVRTVHPDKPTIVDADRERMLQVLVNLLNNAAKYAAKDTETVITV